ncbi:hypothetical protein R1sor_007989 [Riccia sorocarpa]|uniref:Uncharacterized protein n=1 Tax=Riccia sorocarpa TaxID=122646 RepID=A0ABD3HS42_9MARC
MYAIIEDPEDLSNRFMEKYAGEVQFVAYYQTQWHPRILRWTKKYRQYNHSNQESQGSIERLVLASITKAMQMPDSHLLDQTNDEGKEVAWVKNSSDPTRFYEIKLLLIAGHSQLDLLVKLGVKYGSVAGGLNNLVPTQPMTDAEILNMDIPVEDENLISQPDIDHQQENTTAANTNTVTETEFMALALSIWNAVQHSPNLARHGMVFLKEAHKKALDLVALSQCGNRENAGSDEDAATEFQVVEGADGSLKRRRSWVEQFMDRPRRRTQEKENQPPPGNVPPASGTQFEKLHFRRPLHGKKTYKQMLWLHSI